MLCVDVLKLISIVIYCRYEGVESNFLNEITKHWSFEPVDIKHLQDDYEVTQSALYSNRSDIAICSNWLTEKNHRMYDCSQFIDRTCGTFLVPKPVIKNAASNALYAYSKWMWLAAMFSLLLTGVCLTVVSKIIERRITPHGMSNQIYTSWCRSFLDIFAICTNQTISTTGIMWSVKCIFLGSA